MLTITIPEKELFDESNASFIVLPETELHLEHSLISLSKWESKWKKPYLSKDEHSKEEILDYICFMCIDKKPVNYDVIKNLTYNEYKEILEYIGDPYTATKIYDRRPQRGGKQEIYTSEVLYYFMIYYGIPWEAEKWHLNRLLTLIRICGIKGGTTNQSMDMNAIFAQNRALNAARRTPR
jgi:hypothetical protein